MPSFIFTYNNRKRFCCGKQEKSFIMALLVLLFYCCCCCCSHDGPDYLQSIASRHHYTPCVAVRHNRHAFWCYRLCSGFAFRRRLHAASRPDKSGDGSGDERIGHIILTNLFLVHFLRSCSFSFLVLFLISASSDVLAALPVDDF